MSRYDYLIPGLIAFVGLYFKVRQLWRDPRNPALRAICGVLAGLGLAVTVGWGPLYVAIDEATGTPNLARYLEHGLSLVAAASVQSLFLFLGDPDKAPRRARIRWALLAVALAVMGVTFAHADFGTEAPDDFATRYADTPQLAQYMLVFLAYLTVTMIDILRMSARYSRRLPASLLRFGIRLLVLGSLVGMIYIVHKAAFILCAELDVPFPWAEGPVSQVLLLLGIALVAGGLVIPSVGSYLVDAWHWPRRYRLYRDMYPLWNGIHSVIKDVSLHPPRRRPSIRLMSISLYRRVIEIRDGLRELDGYLDPEVIDAATRQAAAGRDQPDRDARAVGEATGIAVMLDQLSRTPQASKLATPTEGRNRVLEDAGANLEADAAWLACVARAYAHSPIVSQCRAARVTRI